MSMAHYVMIGTSDPLCLEGGPEDPGSARLLRLRVLPLLGHVTDDLAQRVPLAQIVRDQLAQLLEDLVHLILLRDPPDPPQGEPDDAVPAERGALGHGGLPQLDRGLQFRVVRGLRRHHVVVVADPKRFAEVLVLVELGGARLLDVRHLEVEPLRPVQLEPQVPVQPVRDQELVGGLDRELGQLVFSCASIRTLDKPSRNRTARRPSAEAYAALPTLAGQSAWWDARLLLRLPRHQPHRSSGA